MKRRKPFAIATDNARDLEDRLHNLQGFDMAMSKRDERILLGEELERLQAKVGFLLEGIRRANEVYKT